MDISIYIQATTQATPHEAGPPSTSEQATTVEEVNRTAHDLARVADSLNTQTQRFRL